jgi:hypothetical protein
MILGSCERGTLLVCLPNELFRFFKEEDHARSFIAGRVRFGRLEVYKSIEDSRRDETEGIAAFTWNTRPNPIRSRTVSLNARFVICTAHPDADKSVMKERFGEHVVRIHNPPLLQTRINSVWREQPRASGECRIVPMEYDKGELREPAPYLIPPHDDTYRQKPKVSPDGTDYTIEKRFVMCLRLRLTPTTQWTITSACLCRIAATFVS